MIGICTTLHSVECSFRRSKVKGGRNWKLRKEAKKGERESNRGFPHSLQPSTTRLVYIRSGGFRGLGKVCNRRRKRTKENPQICESFSREGERGERTSTKLSPEQSYAMSPSHVYPHQCLMLLSRGGEEIDSGTEAKCLSKPSV